MASSSSAATVIAIFLMAVAAVIVFLSYDKDGGQLLAARKQAASTWLQHHHGASGAKGRKGCSSSSSAEKGSLLPSGIVVAHSDLEMRPLVTEAPQPASTSYRAGKLPGGRRRRSLLAIAAGIKQKEIVDAIVSKFFSSDGFSIMVFHYDGVVEEWGDLPWSSSAVHVSAINQTKWWFAKRFLHPDIVHRYDYIFLWDEDLGVQHFNPARYVAVVEGEGLEISQPGVDVAGSQSVHYELTKRARQGKLHKRIYKSRGVTRCYDNSTGPPCTGWVEMMAPVLSRAAWRCVWHLIQNDLVHAWGLDFKFGYCAQGDRTTNIGVVDSEYILHLGIRTLGASSSSSSNNYHDNNSSGSSNNKADSRSMIRKEAYADMFRFQARWKQAAQDDDCWTDPYPQ